MRVVALLVLVSVLRANSFFIPFSNILPIPSFLKSYLGQVDQLLPFSSTDYRALKVTWAPWWTNYNVRRWLWAFNNMPTDLANGRDGWVLRDDQCGSTATAGSGGGAASGTAGAAPAGGAGDAAAAPADGAGDATAPPADGDAGARRKRATNTKWVGRRYWYNQDPAIILIFDKQGRIAGMQSAVHKSLYTPPSTSKIAKTFYEEDGDYWTQTVYFIDPTTICNSGRAKEELAKEGTANGLWIQNGPDPTKNLVKVPIGENEMRREYPTWVEGNCYPSMGKHYWYKLDLSMDCTEFVPYTVLYNNGRLTGFAFIRPVVLNYSFRFDSPPITNNMLEAMMQTVPDCMHQDMSFRTMSSIHVYFVMDPTTVAATCPAVK